MKISAFGQSIEIQYGNIAFQPSGEGYYCSHDQFYLDIKGVAKYHVLPEEDIIVIEKYPELVNDYVINTWLYGTVFAYLLQWHDFLVLHGSAILVNGKAVIFSGNSGAGKSTTAANFIARGYQLLTDDVVVLKRRKDGQLELVPGPGKVKLWADALDNLGHNSANLLQVINKESKFELPVKQAITLPVTVAQFYELNPFSENVLEILPLNNAGKIQTLIKNTYRYQMLKPMNKLSTHLQDIARLAASIEVFKVTRPAGQYRLDELIDALEKSALSVGRGD